MAIAGVIGFLGNEAVALFRIRVGREIGSAALIADGKHARVDGLTSLAVVAGAAGVALGAPIADPIVGLLISVGLTVAQCCTPPASQNPAAAARTLSTTETRR